MKAVYFFLLVILSGTYAAAVPVDPDAPDGIAAVWYSGAAGNTVYVLGTNGECWKLSGTVPDEWEHREEMDVPIPVSEINDWAYYYFKSNDGSHWFRTGGWHILTLPPFSPIQNTSTSLGGVKGLYR